MYRDVTEIRSGMCYLYCVVVFFNCVSCTHKLLQVPLGVIQKHWRYGLNFGRPSLLCAYYINWTYSSSAWATRGILCCCWWLLLGIFSLKCCTCLTYLWNVLRYWYWR